MNTQIENRLFAALASRGIGRFVILQIMRERGRDALGMIRAGASEESAAEYLASFQRRARENLGRYRRERAAELARLATEIRGDLQRHEMMIGRALKF